MKNSIVRLVVVTMFCIGANGLHAQTVKDIDGNVYKTVTIGSQVWMAENLKTTKYNDSKPIPTGNDGVCFYDNSFINKKDYGALYNWYVVNSNKLCPVGWHVASDSS